MTWPRRCLDSLRAAGWLTEDRARAYGTLVGITMLIFGLAALGKIILPAFSDPHWRPTATDFNAFWSGSRLASQGHPALAYDPQAILGMEDTGARSVGLFPYLYPPVWLLLCLPLAALPYPLAFAVFLVSGYAALCCCLRAILPRPWPILPVLSLPAIVLNGMIGQNGLVSGTCFAGAMLLLDRRPMLAGACLGVFAFKPQLAVGVPVLLLFGRRWAALVSCAAVASGLALASWAVLGRATWERFFEALPAISAVLRNPLVWPKLVSMFAAVKLAGGSAGLALGAQGLCAVAALCCVAYVGARRPGAGPEIATLAAAAVLCTPYVMDYDLACLAIPMAWLARRGASSGWLAWEKIVLAAGFLAPAIARATNLAVGVSLAPPIMLAFLAVVMSRVRHDIRNGVQPHSPTGAQPLIACQTF